MNYQEVKHDESKEIFEEIYDLIHKDGGCRQVFIDKDAFDFMFYEDYAYRKIETDSYPAIIRKRVINEEYGLLQYFYLEARKLNSTMYQIVVFKKNIENETTIMNDFRRITPDGIVYLTLR